MDQSEKYERGVVIYDSKYGNTEKIAKSLAAGLRIAGMDITCINTNDVQDESLKDYDFIAIGAPTQMFTASKPMKDFLLRLGGVQGLRGKYAFAFDTKFASRLSGSASKYIERTLKELGMDIVRPRQSAIVDKTEGPLEGGAVEAFERIGFDMGTLLTREGKTLTTSTGGIRIARTQSGVGTE
jgi:flavorubredoxin